MDFPQSFSSSPRSYKFVRPSHGRATRSSCLVEAINFEAQADASDDANAVAGIDSDADAEYETDAEYVVAVPAAAAEPLSVYDVIPHEDGGTVIPNSLMRQKVRGSRLRREGRKVSMILVY